MDNGRLVCRCVRSNNSIEGAKPRGRVMGMHGELDAIASGSQTRSPVEIASPDASLARYFSALQFQSSACQSFSLAVRESVESGVTANALAARLSMGMSEW